MTGSRLAALLLVCALAASTGACWAAPQDDVAMVQIDQYVEKTPQSVTGSIQSLADYLVKPATNDLQKVRAIYGWIVRNIDYDAKALETMSPGDQSPKTVLASRIAVCDGYSQLFEALAKAAGLEAVRVIGFSRGAGYSPGSSIGADPDHAWTAVKADGEYYLIDSTWAAGYIDAKAGFVRRLDDYYFLTSPDQFVYDHLPQDQKYQLLSNPVSKASFEKMVYLRPGFFRNGLAVVSNPDLQIVSDGELTVTFGGPNEALMRARVGDTSLRKDDVAPTLVQRDGDKLKLNASFPKPGTYLLRIYAKQKGNEGPYEWAADYQVKVNELKSLNVFYPETTTTFHEKDASLVSPMAGKLKDGAKETFKLTVPGAEAVSVVVDGDWVSLTKSGDVWEGRTVVRGTEVQVVAQFPGSKSFYVLVKYAVA